MKIGITSLNLEQRSASAYYNSQENGLGAALASLGHTVTVYHLISQQDESPLEEHPAKNLTLKYIACRHLGLHAFPSASIWDAETDCFISFSDHYAGFPMLYRYCRKHNILCLPYLGVISSNNPSTLKRLLSSLLSRNMRFYRKLPLLLTKTPRLADQLLAQGARQVRTVPVCLDEQKLCASYREARKEALLLKYGFQPADRVILFIGRLVPEKQPLLMLKIFSELTHCKAYKLLMLGQGPLKSEIDEYIKEHALSHSVRLISALENSSMWELYCASACYVNLNDHEIFGMSILEALYYECPVIALHAPGPDSILEASPCGSLCSSPEELAQKIIASDTVPADKTRAAHDYITDNYLWSCSAAKILDSISSLRKVD
ncbi:MAG: glycosyltransferase family 4 protein [Lachnospiraceae bacterium]|nr:glycosyltransferase family 4 protein [Lachnospiraceae bacterium]MDE7239925.1 glycosyltransferase family 4 protein [Lachnospiraceae bacterium]